MEHGFRGFLVGIVALVLAGCAIGTPFEDGPAAALPAEETVVVILTETTVLPGPEKHSEFFDRTLAVEKTLEGRPGLIGHSLRVEPFGRRAWTMTVWADADSADAFVFSPTHQDAIAQTFRLVENGRFARVIASRDAVPLDWTEAEAILASEGRNYFE